MRLLYCGTGWLSIVDKIRARLPPGATVTVWDRAVPLPVAAAEIDVLLPSNATIEADVIAAATRLRLIQQPAAGVEGIDRTAASARKRAVLKPPLVYWQ